MECESAAAYTLDEALAAVGFGKFQGFILVYAGIGWFSEAMEIMILSFVGPAVKLQWGLSSSEESLLSSVVFAGTLIGAYSWGLVSDNYGRSMTVITSGTGVISAFAPNYTSLVVLRGLVGFGLGGGHVFLSWFLEFIPTSHRGKWMVIFSTFWTLGTIFEAALAWIVMPILNWRWLLVLSAIPSLSLLPLYGFAPESPRYLCQKGITIQAQQIIETMALVNKRELPLGMLDSYETATTNEECSSSEHMHLLSPAEGKTSQFKSLFSTCSMLFSPKLIQTTLLLWMAFFGNVFLYYGIILLTSQLSISQNNCSSGLLHSVNLKDDSLYAYQLITSFGELPGLLLSAITVDRFGRKLSMAMMFILAGICLLPLVSRQSGILTTGLLFGSRMFSVGTFTVASIYAPEVRSLPSNLNLCCIAREPFFISVSAFHIRFHYHFLVKFGHCYLPLPNYLSPSPFEQFYPFHKKNSKLNLRESAKLCLGGCRIRPPNGQAGFCIRLGIIWPIQNRQIFCDEKY
ncbi:organic cation/carnitine transporter 7-like isoform X2 [Euphorbia lathyris]|uniref:organic cation/carnitine transporter 7-like isoform X2 n=1 Tax=Euphorbia lathyris TaxID=212925 RepID=UPI003313E143